MANKRTVIAADEELLVKGQLTITGNVTQVETTQLVNNLESDELVINSNGDNVTAKLVLNSSTSNATLAYNHASSELEINVPISSTGNITGTFIGDLTGNVTGDVTGNVTGQVSDISNHTTTDLAEGTNLYFTAARVRGNISVTDSGGDGSLSYNSGTGVITYTGPSASEVRAHFSNAEPIQFNTSTGQLSLNPTIAQNTTFSGELRSTDSLGSSENSTKVATTAWVQSNAPGTLTDVYAGDGITTLPANITGSGEISVDGTVVRTTGTQLISGEKTFSAQVNVTADIIPTAANAYNLGSWANHFDNVFANVLHAERLDLGDADLSDVHATFYAGTPTGTIIDTSTAGGLIYEHNAPGSTNPGGYYRVNTGDGIQIASNAVAVDGTVVRTSGTQSIAGAKTFTGSVVLPTNSTGVTQANSDNSTKIATTAYVDNAVSNLIDGAPGALDTLNELANALNDDASIGSVVTNNTNRITTLEGVTISAGTGLSVDNSAILSSPTLSVNESAVDHDNLNNFVADEHVAHSSVILTAGSGLTGGGDITTSRTFNIGAGTGITVNADSIQTDDSAIVHDNLSGFVANEHIDHSGVILTAGDGLDGGGDITTSRSFAVDSTVVRTSGAQTIAGDKTFSGTLVPPASASTTTGAIYYDNSTNEAYIYLGGMARKITPAVDAGDVEGLGAGTVDIYGGQRSVGNVVYHGIKSLDPGVYTTVTEAANVITVDANVNAIKTQFSASGAELSYNAGTGTFTSTADNYLQWKFVTPSTGNVVVNSDDLVTFAAGSGIGISNSGKTITITNTNAADITEVAAGDGLTGGATSGTATLTVGQGDGITVNTSNVAVDNTVVRTSGNQSIAGDKTFTATTQINSLNINSEYSFPTTDGSVSQVLTTNGTGQLSFQSLSSVGGINTVTAGDGLTATTGIGTVELDVVGGYGITVNADSVEVNNTEIQAQAKAAVSASGDLSYNSGTGVFSFTERTDAQVRALFSAGGDLSYNASTGVFSFTNDAGDIESVSITAGSGLTGGGTASSGDASFTLTVGSGTGITVNADDIAITNTGVVADTYGNASHVASFTVNAQGQLTSASDTAIAITSGQVSGLAASATTDTTNANNISSGTLASARLPDLTVADFAGSAVLTSAETFADNDTSFMTSAAIQDKIESYGYSTTVGTVTSIAGGSGLTPASITTSGTLAVGAGSYILVGADDVSVDATTTATAGKVVARDGSGDVYANIFHGTATAARYADLAEKYATDVEYEPGTVVVFGGVAEVTECNENNSPRVAGVISTDPAYMMNSEANGQYIALRGRVPCKVAGKIRKGDVLITSDLPGHAVASDQPHFVGAACIVGKALESKDTDGVGVIEIMV